MPPSALAPLLPNPGTRLRTEGEARLEILRPLVEEGDPEGSVTASSRLLCAALGTLAEETCLALGGRPGDARAAGEAAALLGLVSKVDDEIIDALSFHGGGLPGMAGWQGSSREAVASRVEAFLHPTVRALRTGRAPGSAARLRLAAATGQRLGALEPVPERWRAFEKLLLWGVEVQARAVSTLTRPPGEVTLAEILAVTAAISGAWLELVITVGTLPASASRGLLEEEHRALLRRGLFIQAADSLCDLEEDLSQGHTSSLPGWLASQAEPRAWEATIRSGDADAARTLVRRLGLDEALLSLGWRRRPDPLDRLGEVGALLDWIHAHLAARWQDPAALLGRGC